MGTQANNEAFQEAATTEKSKADHHVLQSHKHLSLDQKNKKKSDYSTIHRSPN